MSAKIDITGQTFARLTVLREDGRIRKEAAWLCSCECGATTRVPGNALRVGRVLSCGCAKRDNMPALRHGMADTRIHRSWMSMLGRCERPTDTAFQNYGGRGIKVCDRWHTFEHFAADMGPMPDTHTLDRIDVNGNYEPSNCRWATYHEQSLNTRRNVVLEFEGQRRTLGEWATLIGVGRSTLAARLKGGWDEARALSTPTLSPIDAAAIAHKTRWGPRGEA